MKTLNLISFVLFSFFHSPAQSIELVEDIVPGPEDSYLTAFSEFKGKILYRGVNRHGEMAVLQYNKDTDQITSLLVNDDVDGEIIYMKAWNEKILIVSYNEEKRNAYISTQNDLSDLTLAYQTVDSYFYQFGSFKNSTIVIKELNISDNFEESVNIVLIDPDYNVTTLIEEQGQNNKFVFDRSINNIKINII